ncbi:MAG: DUF2027 domain-containing protein [Prevotella sp.]|nr:DUF2027 domain-containing protein [Prevotella sp.]
MNKLKIGDKVRFLSEIGGGRVAGFKGNNLVLVEDEDGFQIPTPINEVVKVDTNDYNIAKVHTIENKQGTKEVTTSTKSAAKEEDEDYDPADRPLSYRRPVEERRGGDVLSAYLAFVPMDVKQISSTNFETYFVNDSNYYMRFTYLVAEGANWRLRATAEVEPNTKLFIEEFGREVLNEMERACVQIIAYKRDKSFILKPTVNLQFRIDPVKFYKLHTFQENDFFEAPAMLITIVENDVIPRPLVIDAKQLKQEMFAPKTSLEQEREQRTNDGGMVRRYENAQSKGKAMEKRKNDTLVVDLHAHVILETQAGMSAADILDYQLDVFRKTLEEHKNEKGAKIVFIHGKGEGVLRRSILNELKYKYKKYTYQDASFQEYGYGATQVTIH